MRKHKDRAVFTETEMAASEKSSAPHNRNLAETPKKIVSGLWPLLFLLGLLGLVVLMHWVRTG